MKREIPNQDDGLYNIGVAWRRFMSYLFPKPTLNQRCSLSVDIVPTIKWLKRLEN